MFAAEKNNRVYPGGLRRRLAPGNVLNIQLLFLTRGFLPYGKLPYPTVFLQARGTVRWMNSK